MPDSDKSFEQRRCERYIELAADETSINQIGEDLESAALIVTQGFEERSVGVVESFATARRRVSEVWIARYSKGEENARYRTRFDDAAKAIAGQNIFSLENDNDAAWVDHVLAKTQARHLIVDITGISNRALFGVLGTLSKSHHRISVSYSEAAEYWPTESEWKQIQSSLNAEADLPDIIDEKPWLFSHQHTCKLISGHEGYDSAGSPRAIIAFLPFKAARLASILGNEEYAAFVYIAGKPRLERNAWRLDALKAINSHVMRSVEPIVMNTFGYRSAMGQLTRLLFEEPGLLLKYDVHVATLGSKLQVLACWALSSLVPSLTMITSVPSHYYPEAFSNGIGMSWIFDLVSPHDSESAETR